VYKFRLFSGNIPLYLSTDVITWAGGHDGAENLALTVPRDRIKLEFSPKSHIFHTIPRVYLEKMDTASLSAAY